MKQEVLEIVEFFSRNHIPILPCYGITDGVCNCRNGVACPSPGKHPLMRKWQMLATTNIDRIKSWWGTGEKKGKNINLAIATGRKHPITGKYATVVDFDLVDHPLRERLEKESKTLTQRSGGGGDHAIYWSKMPIKNSCKLIDDKVDIRGNGGIIIIAPSMHKTGNKYKFTCDINDIEIKDFPEFLEKKLRIAISEQSHIKEVSKVKKTSSLQERVKNSKNEKLWSKKSISEIRESILNGKLIPNGARNVTMHRILSSDRARGAADSQVLKGNARRYLSGFENPETLELELDLIIKSVMRYPAYNNSHEKVNSLYLAWLSKKGYKAPETLETLETLDETFFSKLEVTSDHSKFTSLKQICLHRENFLKKNGLEKFATYRPQLLAKKLKDLGYMRYRTASGNYWGIKLFEELVASSDEMINTKTSVTFMEMKTMVDELKDEKKKSGLKDGDIIDYHGKKVRVELIKTKTKVKAHSREHFYQGRTGYDYNKALMNLLPRLSEEMVNLLEKDELVMDREKTNAWIDTVKTGDIIGVKSARYAVGSGALRFPGSDPALTVNLATSIKDKPGEFSIEDTSAEILMFGMLDHARELGFLEILWRDGKPFGEEDLRDMTVVLLHDLEEEPDSSVSSASPTPKRKPKKSGLRVKKTK